MSESTDCDSVGDVCELVRTEMFDKVFKDGRFDELGMEFSNTVDFETADCREESHSDTFRLGFFDQRHSSKSIVVTGELGSNTLQEEEVDVVDDGQVSREQGFHQGDRPGLECFRKNGMVRVGEDLAGDRPGRVPVEGFFVDKNSNEFRDSESWMGVIELDGNVVGEV